MKLYTVAKLPAWPSPATGQQNMFQSESFVSMKRAVIALFADMERKGELD